LNTRFSLTKDNSLNPISRMDTDKYELSMPT
jgi:hypothetical protein